MGARSRRLLMVITQEPTQSLTALHGPGAADACIAGEQRDVVLPLMIALSMVMLNVFAQGAPWFNSTSGAGGSAWRCRILPTV